MVFGSIGSGAANVTLAAAQAVTGAQTVVMGKVVGAFGVHGWLKVRTFSDDPASLQQHPRWLIGNESGWRDVEVLDSEVHGNVLVAQLQGVENREAAALLRGTEVAVRRDRLPPAGEGEYYWSDLEGLKVVNVVGEDLGWVAEVFSNGAQEILRVRDGDVERLVPFVDAYVQQVDLDARSIVVDWQRDW